MKSNFSTIILTVMFLASTFNASSAQVDWTKDVHNPVLSGGDPGTWNRHVGMPSVLYNPDSARYEMWYSGWYDFTSQGRIGFATSPHPDSAWTKNLSPVLEPGTGTWDVGTVEFPMVIRENGVYRMWYSGFDPIGPNAIGYAESTDRITWIKVPGPVMGPGTEAWEAGGPVYCTVMPVQGGGYKMWYSAWNQQYDSVAIGYAESVYGFIWQRPLNNPVLTTGSPGEWDDHYVIGPRVLFIDGIYYIWYTGFQDEYLREVGLATSTDGFTWTKYDDPNTTNHPYAESDPVLRPSPGQWDGTYIQSATMILIDDTLHTWYSGSRYPSATYVWKIGKATSTDSPWGLFENTENVFPSKYMLHQNYPNPFNPTTTIEFSMPKTEFVTLKIYNLLGQEVTTLVSDKLTPGNYKYSLNASAFASGVYYYKILTGSFNQTRKLILMK